MPTNRASRQSTGAETETAPATDGGRACATVRALYVTGPTTLGRYLLSDGIVSLGRDAGATIVLDDPRVSRSHAVLHLGDEIEISDLGSSNGTFVEGARLVPHQPESLPTGQTFFIGDSALVVRDTALPRTCPGRIRDVDELRARLDRAGEARLTLVVHVRARGGPLPATCESILSETLHGPRDWLMWLGQDQICLGLEVTPDGQPGAIERVVSDALRGWRIAAEVSARFLSREQLDAGGGGLAALVSPHGPVKLERGPVVFRDPTMAAIHQTLLRVAAKPVNVLVLGETGAGKDVVASLVHERSMRAEKPLVSVNCAGLPEALLESELFGYERGAFTGAVNAKPGLLETAEGGTVFLDEIGDLPLPLQAKLLRIIEAREVTRLGSTQTRRLDVRFIAATNRNLPLEVTAGRFRQDLFYRLNTVTITVPPLRDRPAEIEPLARLFVESAAARFESAPPELSAASIAALKKHSWPGNVRELRNTIDRAVVMCGGSVIEPTHLALLMPAGVSPAPPEDVATAADTTAERDRIERALSQNGWNQSRAAKVLGIPRRTLVRKIARLGFPRPRVPRGPEPGPSPR